ncbi:MAG: TetR/AcrR family transcriptional regulator [Desulfuromonadales bacterium]|nr:TetR/AcrR family transcriptional regulator [Desulfuromonadales bacterium]
MGTKGEMTRQKIIDDATGIFQRKGFGTTSVNDLLSISGVTKGSLYFHFPGKEALGIAVLKKEAETFMMFLDDVLIGETPAACLDNFFNAALRKHQGTGFVGGCLFGNTALEASDSSPVYARVVAEVFNEWTEKLRKIIAQAQALELMRQDMPAEQLAQTVIATIEGAIMQSRLHKSAEPMTRALKTLRIFLELKIDRSDNP